jgi:uncharacterized phage protein (TIGR01671 family)
MFKQEELEILPIRDLGRTDMVWMQFTGLIDFKGTPIFGGDKVMATYREWDYENKRPLDEVSSPGIVEWYDTEGMWGVRLGDPEGESEFWGMIKFKVLEVYGNIYENPPNS